MYCIVCVLSWRISLRYSNNSLRYSDNTSSKSNQDISISKS